MKHAIWILAMFGIVLPGCITHAAMYDKLAERASFDLDCPPNQLTITELDQSNAGVRGCGRQATYLGVCQGFGCTWIQQGGRAEVSASGAQ